MMLETAKEKLLALQRTMATRLDDKDQLITSLEQQVFAQSVVAKKKTKRKPRYLRTTVGCSLLFEAVYFEQKKEEIKNIALVVQKRTTKECRLVTQF